jgi:FG-GAP repeat
LQRFNSQQWRGDGVMRHALLVIVSLLFSLQPALAQPSTQQQKLVANNAIGAAAQGHSVGLSADGNTAIVGGPLDNSNTGAAWVWTRSNDVWTQQQKLVANNAIGAAAQGQSVALSGDGNTAIVGGNVDNGVTGAAWVWTRSNDVWTQQQKLVANNAIGFAGQGFSVALSSDGNTAIVGGPLDNPLSSTSSVGAAWVWTRSSGVWTQQQKLVATRVVFGGPEQGFSVALSADGNTAIVGGPLNSSNFGTAWVYTRSNGVWTQGGLLFFPFGQIGNPQLGFSVALSGDGNTAIGGGPFDNPSSPTSSVGAAWVYTRTNDWIDQAKLVANNAVGEAQQGTSVALSGDGNTAIVGGPQDNSSSGGAAWVWTRSNDVWTQRQKLVANNGFGAKQGTSVALSADGNTAIVGGTFDNSGTGAAWVFVKPLPFSAFNVQLTVYPNQSQFSIKSNFTLGTTSDGIDPPTEPVTLQIGSFTITIPAGSFVKAGLPGYFTFVGVVDNVNLEVLIKLTSGNNYIFGVDARNVSLTIVNPVTVTLTVGNDSGTTSVNAVIINTR